MHDAASINYLYVKLTFEIKKNFAQKQEKQRENDVSSLFFIFS